LDEKDFQKRIQRVSKLTAEIEEIADPALRASSKELVQVLMELHGNALERIMEIVFQAGDPGVRIIDECGRDSLVSSLLVLYGLHPEDFSTRVTRALDRIGSRLRKQGGEVTLLGIQDAMVRLRIDTTGHACGSTAKNLRSTVEEALYEAAPDITQLTIEGLDGQPASGFVALETLMADPLCSPIGAGGASGLRGDGAD
jgi:Fe-S cluster biogenesis protein NfuA